VEIEVAEQIIVNIVRPEVGIAYLAESPEADLPDRLAAAELALHALARYLRKRRSEMGLPCPSEVVAIVDPDSWRRGM
jgi:hypothetical protein